MFRRQPLGAFDPTWIQGVKVDGKNKEFDILYKYPPTRVRHNASFLLYL